MKSHITVYCLIHGFKIINDVSILNDKILLLSKNVQDISNFLGQEHMQQFKIHMGSYFANNLYQNNHLVFNIIEEKEVSEDSRLFMEKVCNCYLNEYQNICNFLWFIKDSSVNIHLILAGSIELQNLSSAISQDLFYNSNGELKETEFSLHQIKKALYFRKKLYELLNKKEVIFNQVFKEGIRSQPNSFNYIDFTKENRIDVAFRFLNIARSSNFVPHKIFSYMSFFEALFTINNKMVSESIAKRVCKYLNKSGDEEKTLYELLKKSYDIRSRFVHANLGKYTSNEILIVSSKTDDVVREVFIKIINNNSEAQIFIGPKGKFEKWIKNLWLYNNSTAKITA
ncbi:hypothetical protein [Arcicella lustrica]|uniref:Apea-like HEPN domain-containing protein n=1 Tax=Arcicella lustrica TaxID=2984196 RepID=A0ABU5SKF6_9BACT|nr:hypothetical protein [Arcicella sp. DC25W]MEA5427494.1 hypothetical protein [Arcicella sp. DC25W]